MKILVIGAGFSGATVARELVSKLPCHVEVWDQRSHLAGNCHTERDRETGVMIHKYGPHIFNTDNERVWEYVRNFGELRPFVNRVKAVTDSGVFGLPINLLTINQLFGKNLNPTQAKDYVSSLADKSITNPQNFEDQALAMLGRRLYDTFFRGYTIKQWGCDPKELPASILKRLPVRFNYDDNYYDRKYQAIPVDGYTEVVRKILDHPRIRVFTNRQFVPKNYITSTYDKPSAIIYTGPIDAFFDHAEGRLGYRTVEFERIDTNEIDYQGNAVINYTSQAIPWTRIHEHKHFMPWEANDRTVAFREYSRETRECDEPYYPKRLSQDMTKLHRYREMAQTQVEWHEIGVPVCFLGRLATYRYLDMETVIGEAIEMSDEITKSLLQNSPFPTGIKARP